MVSQHSTAPRPILPHKSCEINKSSSRLFNKINVLHDLRFVFFVQEKQTSYILSEKNGSKNEPRNSYSRQ